MHLFIIPLYATKTNLFHQSWSLYQLKDLPGISYNLTVWDHNFTTHNLIELLTCSSEQRIETSTILTQLHTSRGCAFFIFHREYVREEQHFNLFVGFQRNCTFLGCTENNLSGPIITTVSRQVWQVCRWCLSSLIKENVPSMRISKGYISRLIKSNVFEDQGPSLCQMDRKETTWLIGYMCTWKINSISILLLFFFQILRKSS